MNKLREKMRWYFLGTLFVSTVFIWYGVLAEARDGKLTVAVLDVGQGDAIFIEAPNGNQVLIDGGPGRNILSALGEIMPFYDRSIDMIIVTNPDKDHIGGFVDVLRSYKVGLFMEPGTKTETNIYKTLMSEVGVEQANQYIARRGMKILLDKDVHLDILFPDRDVSGLSTNDGSIVARLVYGGSSFMLTGDSPQGVEEYLVRLDGEALKSDVLKVGHHGSKTSSSVAFLGLVAPQFAAISEGKGNSYGHPHKETLDSLARFDIQTLVTEKEGNLVFESYGEKFERVR